VTNGHIEIVGEHEGGDLPYSVELAWLRAKYASELDEEYKEIENE